MRACRSRVQEPVGALGHRTGSTLPRRGTSRAHDFRGGRGFFTILWAAELRGCVSLLTTSAPVSTISAQFFGCLNFHMRQFLNSFSPLSGCKTEAMTCSRAVRAGTSFRVQFFGRSFHSCYSSLAFQRRPLWGNLRRLPALGRGSGSMHPAI